jgi:hypothetical protein
MSKPYVVVLIHPEALAKPALGAPCNGCGVCCLLEPCPLGVVLSGRRQGACAALRWHDTERQYRCGALAEPQTMLAQRLPRLLQGLAPTLAWVLRRWARRWVAAGMGCDSTVQVAGQALIIK